jgi:Fic family protein
MDKRLDERLRGVSPPAWPAVLARISEIDEFKGWWRGRFHPPPSWLGGLRARSIARSAKASVGIDWVGLPRRDGPGPGLPPPPAVSEELRRSSTACYAHLLKTIFDRHAEMPLSRELLLLLHSELLRSSPGDRAHSGAYRSVPDRLAFLPRRSVEAIALRPADPEQIPTRMEALIAWTNDRLGSRSFHPLLVAAGFVLEFLAIRPFAAGNGRASRLLTSLLLLRCGYSHIPYAPIEKIVAERKAEYYLALRKSQSSLHLPRPDMGPWFLAFLDAMRAQTGELSEALAPRPREGRLSGNQEGALALVDRHREITNRLVAGALGLPRDTAKQVLNRLVALNLLVRVGAGRAARYRRAEPA